MRLTAYLPRNLLAKKYSKSFNIWQNYGHDSVAPFLAHPVAHHKLNSWRWLAAASVAVPIKPVPAMLTAVSVDEEIKLGPVVMDEYIVMSVTVDVVLEAIRLNVF